MRPTAEGAASVGAPIFAHPHPQQHSHEQQQPQQQGQAQQPEKRQQQLHPRANPRFRPKRLFAQEIEQLEEAKRLAAAAAANKKRKLEEAEALAQAEAEMARAASVGVMDVDGADADEEEQDAWMRDGVVRRTRRKLAHPAELRATSEGPQMLLLAPPEPAYRPSTPPPADQPTQQPGGTPFPDMHAGSQSQSQQQQQQQQRPIITAQQQAAATRVRGTHRRSMRLINASSSTSSSYRNAAEEAEAMADEIIAQQRAHQQQMRTHAAASGTHAFAAARRAQQAAAAGGPFDFAPHQPQPQQQPWMELRTPMDVFGARMHAAGNSSSSSTSSALDSSAASAASTSFDGSSGAGSLEQWRATLAPPLPPPTSGMPTFSFSSACSVLPSAASASGSSKPHVRRSMSELSIGSSSCMSIGSNMSSSTSTTFVPSAPPSVSSSVGSATAAILRQTHELQSEARHVQRRAAKGDRDLMHAIMSARGA